MTQFWGRRKCVCFCLNCLIFPNFAFSLFCPCMDEIGSMHNLGILPIHTQNFWSTILTDPGCSTFTSVTHSLIDWSSQWSFSSKFSKHHESRRQNYFLGLVGWKWDKVWLIPPHLWCYPPSQPLRPGHPSAAFFLHATLRIPKLNIKGHKSEYQ